MMQKSNQQIHDEIISQVKKEGSSYKYWYLGIASNPKQRLFVDHNVPKENAWWIYSEASSSADARTIEEYMLKNYGFDGGSGGGDISTTFIYAYRKKAETNP